MAISAGTVWEMNASATAGNVNAGGFNTLNPNMPSDLTTDAGTGNTASPVVSSASYNFVAGDVGDWVYIQSGTNWIQGFYQITSVASNKATVNATAGSAVIWSATQNDWIPSTSDGVATVGTPTSGKWAVDYSQATAANNSTTTDLAATNGNTAAPVVTSASYTFGVNTVGNILRVNSGTNWTTGWYEIISVSGGAATLDRAVASVASPTSGTWRIGGAMSLNSTTDDAFLESGVAGNIFYVKAGNFTFGQTISITVAIGSATVPIRLVGYSSIRGDYPIGSSRPNMNAAAVSVTIGNNWFVDNLIIRGTAANMFSTGLNCIYRRCSFINESTTAGRAAVGGATDVKYWNCEIVSYRGTGFSAGNALSQQCIGCYFHDSNIGINNTNSSISGFAIINCIFKGIVTTGINMNVAATASQDYFGNTFYGAETPIGTGISFAASCTDMRLYNNIFYGLTTGVSLTSSGNATAFLMNNDFFNNTTNANNVVAMDKSNMFVDPGFSGLTYLSGTGATSTTNVLTDSGADFSAVTDNVDFVYLVSGTGTGFTAAKFLITAHTTTTLTLSSNITTSGSGSAITWNITLGSNFAIGTNLASDAFPQTFEGANTTSYLDIGAAQRQPASGGGGGLLTHPGMGGGMRG